MPNRDDLKPIEYARKYLRVSKASMYRFTSERRIRYYKLGRCCWFRVADLEAFREARAVEVIE